MSIRLSLLLTDLTLEFLVKRATARPLHLVGEVIKPRVMSHGTWNPKETWMSHWNHGFRWEWCSFL